MLQRAGHDWSDLASTHIVNSNAMNMHVHVFVWASVSSSFGYIPRSEIAVSPRQFYVYFLRHYQTAIAAEPFYTPTSSVWGSHQQCVRVLISWHLCQCLLFSVVIFVHYSPLRGYEMVSHCGFDLQFAWLATLQIFSWAYWLFVYLLLRNVFLNPLPLFIIYFAGLSYVVELWEFLIYSE